MKTPLVFIFYFSFICFVFAQNKMANSGFTVKIPLGSCLSGDIMTQSLGIGIGFEKRISSQISYNQDGVYLLPDHSSWKKSVDFVLYPVDNIQGIKSVSALRYYFKADERLSGFFTSLDFMNMYTYSKANNFDVSRYRNFLSLNAGLLVYGKPDKSGFLTLEILGGYGTGYQYVVVSGVSSENPCPDSFYYKSALYSFVNAEFKIGIKL